MLCMFVDIGLKFYAVPLRETLRSRSWVINFDRLSGKAQVRRATLSRDSSFLFLESNFCEPYVRCHIYIYFVFDEK